MIITFLQFQFKSFWSNRLRLEFWISHVLFMSLTLGYAWAISTSLHVANSNEWEFISREDLISGLGAFLVWLTALRSFIPNYQPLFYPIPNHWPVSPSQRYIVSVLHDFQKRFFFYVVLGIVLTMSLQQTLDWMVGIYWLSCLFGAQFLVRLIQYGIDFKYKQSRQLFICYGITTVLLIGLFLGRSDQTILYFGVMATAMVWFVLGYILSIQPKEPSRRTKRWFTSWGSMKALIYNKKARIPLLMAMILKTVLLVATVWLEQKKGKSVMDQNFFFCLFYSPTIYLTYVFNNVWGFWRMNFVSLYIRSGEVKDYVKEFFRLIQFPLVFDLITTLIAISALSYNQAIMLIFYLTSFVLTLALSLVSSFLVPKKVDSSFQMRGGTSQRMAFLMMLFIGALVTIKINAWFYILIPTYLILAVICIANLKGILRSRRHKIFRDLFT